MKKSLLLSLILLTSTQVMASDKVTQIHVEGDCSNCKIPSSYDKVVCTCKDSHGHSSEVTAKGNLTCGYIGLPAVNVTFDYDSSKNTAKLKDIDCSGG